MADIRRRTKKARKDAEKRARHARRRSNATRKAMAGTSPRGKAKTVAGLGAAVAAAIAAARLLKGGDDDGGQRYRSEPDNLPNTPDRPAATTPPPGAGAAQTGADTGSTTDTERARAEQTG
jgi:hypothetical protein